MPPSATSLSGMPRARSGPFGLDCSAAISYPFQVLDQVVLLGNWPLSLTQSAHSVRQVLTAYRTWRAGTNPETRIRARPFFLGKRACAAKHLVRLVRYLALPAVVASGTSTSFPDFTS